MAATKLEVAFNIGSKFGDDGVYTSLTINYSSENLGGQTWLDLSAEEFRVRSRVFDALKSSGLETTSVRRDIQHNGKFARIYVPYTTGYMSEESFFSNARVEYVIERGGQEIFFSGTRLENVIENAQAAVLELARNRKDEDSNPILNLRSIIIMSKGADLTKRILRQLVDDGFELTSYNGGRGFNKTEGINTLVLEIDREATKLMAGKAAA